MHPVTLKQEMASASGDSKSVVAGDVKGIQVPWWSEENIFEGLKDHFLQRTILDTDCVDMVLHLSVFLSVASICYILRNP